jgi:hypothetical protein
MDPRWGPVVAAAGDAVSTPQGATINVFNFGGGRCGTTEHVSNTPRGLAIDVSNFDSGHCRTCQQHSSGGPLSKSSTLVVAAAGPTGSTPQGARHPYLQLWWWPLPDLPAAPRRGPRHLRLQLWWWSLPDLPAAPPRGLVIDVSNFGGGRCRTYRQHPLGGPPCMSPTSVVAAARPTGSTPKGPAIYVSNFSGGHCRTYRQHPPGAPIIDVFNFGGGRCRTCREHRQGRAIHVSNFRTSSTSRGLAVNAFLSVDGGRSRTSSSSTSRGPAIDCRQRVS